MFSAHFNYTDWLQLLPSEVDQACGEARHWKAELGGGNPTYAPLRISSNPYGPSPTARRHRFSPPNLAGARGRLRNAELEQRIAAAQAERGDTQQTRQRTVVLPAKRSPGAGKAMACALRRRKLGL